MLSLVLLGASEVFWPIIALVAQVMLPQQDRSYGLIEVEGVSGERTALRYSYAVPDDPLRHGATLIVESLPLSRQGVRYELRLTEYDCAMRTRETSAIIQYSAVRDPRTIRLDPHRVGREGSDVADQLALVCDGDTKGRTVYGGIDNFLQNRPRR